MSYVDEQWDNITAGQVDAQATTLTDIFRGTLKTSNYVTSTIFI